MDMEVYSRTLQEYLARLVNESDIPVSDKIRLRNLTSCGSRLVMPSQGEMGSFLLASKGKAKFFGITHCNNSFACPVCTARKMSGYAEKFAALIDFMTKKGYFGFMMTFTVPHLRFMSLRETMDILYESFSYYRRMSKLVKKNKNGTSRTSGSASGKFYKAVELKHYVNVCEFTFGKNGWHPHFHGIYFVPIKYKDDILKYARELNDFWLHTTKRITAKSWEKYKHFENAEVLQHTLDNLYLKCEKDTGCWISQKDGKILQATSSNYIAGWGANRELSGLMHKNANDGHYTPHQILELAYKGYDGFAALYLEFCLQLVKGPVHPRVIWSRTEIRQYVKASMQISKCRTLVKKKDCEEWKILLWFSKEEWCCLKEFSRIRKCPIFSNLLYLAAEHPKLLYDFLDGLSLSYHKRETHYFSNHIEDIFNSSFRCAS